MMVSDDERSMPAVVNKGIGIQVGCVRFRQRQCFYAH
jgi:hypothetical protein